MQYKRYKKAMSMHFNNYILNFFFFFSFVKLSLLHKVLQLLNWFYNNKDYYKSPTIKYPQLKTVVSIEIKECL